MLVEVLIEYVLAEAELPCLYYGSRDRLVYGIVLARSGDQAGLRALWSACH